MAQQRLRPPVPEKVSGQCPQWASQFLRSRHGLSGREEFVEGGLSLCPLEWGSHHCSPDLNPSLGNATFHSGSLNPKNCEDPLQATEI